MFIYFFKIFRVAKLTQCGEYPYAKYKKYVYSTRYHMGIYDSLLPDRPALDDIYDSVGRINESGNKSEVRYIRQFIFYSIKGDKFITSYILFILKEIPCYPLKFSFF